MERAMDLDELKEKSRKISAPNVDTKGERKDDMGIDNLIRVLKEEDQKERKALKRGFPLSIIAAVIFSVAFAVLFLAPDATPNRSGLFLRGTLMILYIFVAVGIGRKLKGMSRIDYGEPVISFLAKAEKRYKFNAGFYSMDSYLIIAVVFTVLLAYGTFVLFRDVLRRYFDVLDPLIGIAATVGFLLPVYAFGIWATRKNWKKDRESIWLQIKQMREYLEREERNGNS
jgi:hypothetical protein